MDGLMWLANQPPATLDPLVHAGVVSFAFVFIHPFGDGNGRVGRLAAARTGSGCGAGPPARRPRRR
ncbi:MAG: hypothetical protein HC933_07835 [Pleurocapsa sp. SU_196_0]|nr:hypothetical protein [Pleurocapsa sp. SU_196_0]